MRKLHLVEQERSYEIVRVITLPAIDYENFITDMCADRQFIENNAALCAEAAPMKCLLIRQRSKADGILVIPDGPNRTAYVKWAAYILNV